MEQDYCNDVHAYFALQGVPELAPAVALFGIENMDDLRQLSARNDDHLDSTLLDIELSPFQKFLFKIAVQNSAG
jgi:hypothetical protein